MKILLMLIMSVSLLGCLKPEQTVNVIERSPSGNNNPHENDKEVEVQVKSIVTDISFKNYNQYNMSLSKITGINRSRVNDLFLKVKNSLPANNSPELYNSFTQLSYTRLAFEYCSLFIDESEIFSGMNFETTTNENIINLLIENFFDQAPSTNSDLYAPVYRELGDVLDNKEISTEGQLTYVPTSTSVDIQRMKLTKISCSLLLSSHYFTTI